MAYRIKMTRRDTVPVDLPPVSLNEVEEKKENSASRMNAPISAPTPRTRAFSHEMVDEAFADVASRYDLNETQQRVLRFSLATDYEGQGVGSMYHLNQAGAMESYRTTAIAQRHLNIRQVLTDAQVGLLTRYAPEYTIRFKGDEMHDHAMAAAMRIIDHRLVMSRVPAVASVSDVGGNPYFHISHGHDHVHCCNPDVDSKDATRTVLRDMRIRRLEKTSDDPIVRELACRYVAADQQLVCRQDARECLHKSPVITAVHVYDIPMSDWPSIMRNKSARLVEGCILFSNRFFEDNMGTLGSLSARYEIDVGRDIFRMGFVGSAAWWYQHKWSSYMHYAVDQTMYHEGEAYLYKVIERREDTLFFRILRGPATTRVPDIQHYALPSVPVVQVNGFDLTTNHKDAIVDGVRRQIYHFPKPLWDNMLNQAILDHERGRSDYATLYNYYRSVAPRQTINAVLVMGGHTVEHDELRPLIVHAVLAAAVHVIKTTRELRGVTDAIKEQRAKGESLWYRTVKALIKYVDVTSIFSRVLNRIIDSKAANYLNDSLMFWDYQIEIKQFPLSVINDTKDSQIVIVAASDESDLFLDFASYRAPVDLKRAIDASPQLKAAIDRVLGPDTDSIDLSDGIEARSVTEPPTTAPPTYVTEDSRTVPEVKVSPEARRLAVREAISEARAENFAIANMSKRAMSACMRAGAPSEQSLKDFAEEYSNPDIVYVRNGIVQFPTALGFNTLDHAAVYCPLVNELTGTNFQTLHDRNYCGRDDKGLIVSRDYKVVDDINFNGYVLVHDRLLVFNGPAILMAMEKALTLSHNYAVTMNEAPPGKGKTYSIVQAYRSGDVVMGPVRESTHTTRREIQQANPLLSDLHRYVRTVDSYLVNYESDPLTKDIAADTLFADEAYMTHSGKWCAVAALLGVKHIVAYGDRKQIPHVSRVNASTRNYVRLSSDQTIMHYETRRCPPQLVAAWGCVRLAS